MKDEVTSSDDPITFSSDDLLSVLSDSSRRTVLFHLRQHGAGTLDELVDVVTEVDTFRSGETDRGDVRTELIHNHVPKLEDEGLLTYDASRHIVESTNLRGSIGEWLDLAVRHQISFENATRSDDRAADRDEIRVLLVDDEPGLSDAIGAYIERENDDIAVTTAMSSLEAVSALEDESFDCIVSDYQMPAISGLDFLKLVRQHDADTPFIVFTAKGSETIASQAIETGVTDYVQKKPDTDQYDELSGRIRKAVDRS